MSYVELPSEEAVVGTLEARGLYKVGLTGDNGEIGADTEPPKPIRNRDMIT